MPADQDFLGWRPATACKNLPLGSAVTWSAWSPSQPFTATAAENVYSTSFNITWLFSLVHTSIALFNCPVLFFLPLSNRSEWMKILIRSLYLAWAPCNEFNKQQFASYADILSLASHLGISACCQSRCWTFMLLLLLLEEKTNDDEGKQREVLHIYDVKCLCLAWYLFPQMWMAVCSTKHNEFHLLGERRWTVSCNVLNKFHAGMRFCLSGGLMCSTKLWKKILLLVSWTFQKSELWPFACFH